MKAHCPQHRSLANLEAIRKLSLSQYLLVYFRGRDVTYQYSQLANSRLRLFIEWIGRDIPISELTCDMVNDWLASVMQESKRSKATIHGYRRYIYMLMNFAYLDGACDEPPVRIKRIKVQRHVIQSFTLRQIRKIVNAAKDIPDYFPNGVKKSDFWRGIVLAAYSTGLRRGDLLTIKRDQITHTGLAQVLQSKTGHIVCVRFSQQALYLIRKMRDPGDDRAFRWPYSDNAFNRLFQKVLRQAGIEHGSFKWLRRAAGSHAEAANPGDGPRLLGHRSLAVFRDHYEDQTITKCKPVEPPRLGKLDVV